MPKTKVAVTLDSEILRELDALIADQRFPNRSQAVEAALAEKLERLALNTTRPGGGQARSDRGEGAC
jgi:metal-responsive CopG/Arc/MetJ family transcriptional regulator